MRLIDAYALLPMMKYATTDNEIGVFPIKIGFNTIAKVIDDAPTVDAVPVIRCEECKWYYRGGATCMFWDGANGMCGDDFCGKAEREEE